MQNPTSLCLKLALASTLLWLSACGSGSNHNPTSSASTNSSVPNIALDPVIRDDSAPNISQLSPNNAPIQARQVLISATVSDDNAVQSVIITNGQESVEAQRDGDNFSAVIYAVPGRNNYLVTASDEANNTSTLKGSFYFGARASAGGAHSGVIQNKKIYAWGRNNKGQVGTGAITRLGDDSAMAVHPISPTLVSAPSQDGQETQFLSLAFNQNASSALDINGAVWSWGDGNSGQLGLGIAGDGIIDETDQTRPQKISGLTDIVAISRGLDYCLALKSDGSVLAFGGNANGQLGDGSDQNQDSPVAVSGLTNIVQISASTTSYAIDSDGNVWAWGSNKYGQLANGTVDTDMHSTPVQITFDEPVISVASGKGHALALTQSGRVYAWGLNASSQVGMNITGDWGEDVLTPKLLPWFEDAIAVWAKGNQSFVKRSDGKIYPWGQNILGTLGVGFDGDVEQPVSAIYGLEDVQDLGNGALHTLAIRDDGQVFSWGWSFEGSLGGGDSTIHLWAYLVPLFIALPES